jgi:membrane protease subunit (stomatin/prohibitin family)
MLTVCTALRNCLIREFSNVQMRASAMVAEVACIHLSQINESTEKGSTADSMKTKTHVVPACTVEYRLQYTSKLLMPALLLPSV